MRILTKYIKRDLKIKRPQNIWRSSQAAQDDDFWDDEHIPTKDKKPRSWDSEPRTTQDEKMEIGLKYQLELDHDPMNNDPKFNGGEIRVYIPGVSMANRARQEDYDYEAVIRFSIVDAGGKPDEKALSVHYLWIYKDLYKKLGLGSLLIYEAASLCARDYKYVNRFEIEGAISQAFGFYFSLGLHSSTVFSRGHGYLRTDRIHPLILTKLPPAPKISESSLREITKQNFRGLNKAKKFDPLDLGRFTTALNQRKDFHAKMFASKLLESDLDSILLASATQARNAGWLI